MINYELQKMSLRQLSAYSLELKSKLENPDNFALKEEFDDVEIERKKKKLTHLLTDFEYGGHKCNYLKKQIQPLKIELLQKGIDVMALEPEFVRQSIYSH